MRSRQFKAGGEFSEAQSAQRRAGGGERAHGRPQDGCAAVGSSEERCLFLLHGTSHSHCLC